MDAAALLLFLVRGALLLALAGLVQRGARRGSAGLRYAMGTAAFAALLLLPLVPALVPRVALPIAALHFSAPAPAPALASNPVVPVPSAGTSAGPSAVELAAPAALPESTFDGGAALLGVWLAGAVALLGLHLARRVELARRVRRGEELGGPAWDERLRRAAAAIGVGRAVRIVASTEVDVPLVLGLRRPVIVLPEGARGWDGARLDSVLRHELVHVRRADGVVQMLALVARALHWPDPLAWIAHADLVRAREQSCDDRVLASGVPSSLYAGHLLAVVTELGRDGRAPRHALAMASSPEISVRVRAVLDPARPRGLGSRSAGGVLLAALALAAPLGALHLQEAEGSALERVRALVALRDRPTLDAPTLAFVLGALGDDRRVDPRTVPLDESGPRQGDLPETTPGKEAARVLVRQRAAALAPLRVALGARAAPEREKAAWALGCIGARSSAPELADLLANDPSENVRRIAAWALGEMSARSERLALEAALQDTSAPVRAQSAHSLGDLLDARAVPALVTALRDPVPAVRERAAHGLGDLAQGSSIPALRAALGDHDPNVREMVAWALRECGGER